MPGSMKIVGLLAVIGALVVLVARHGGAVTGLDDPDQLSLVYKIGLLILVGSVALRMFRDRFGEAIQAALMWVVVGLALVAGYTYRFELKDVGDRMMAEVVPGRAAARGLDPRLRLQHTFMPAGDASLTTAQVNQKIH